jgi:putative Mg2+ transporter-C (MgtC) family protein
MPMNEIWKAIAEDFADLPDAAQATRVVLRLILAALLGGVLGFEREQHRKQAGLRTHMLVALGAALFVLVPQQAKMSEESISRVIQGLLAGIGFLGAGTILQLRERQDIKGLTTAASIWLTAAIGVTAGLGREATAIVATVLALVILALLPYVEYAITRRTNPVQPLPPDGT